MCQTSSSSASTSSSHHRARASSRVSIVYKLYFICYCVSVEFASSSTSSRQWVAAAAALTAAIHFFGIATRRWFRKIFIQFNCAVRNYRTNIFRRASNTPTPHFFWVKSELPELQCISFNGFAQFSTNNQWAIKSTKKKQIFLKRGLCNRLMCHRKIDTRESIPRLVNWTNSVK